MASANPMTSLYRRLAAAGVDRKYAQTVALPEWWSDDLAETQAAKVQAVGILSNHLRIPFELLWNENELVSCPDDTKTKFKRTKGTEIEDLRWAKCIAQTAAEYAAEATPQTFAGLPDSAGEIRCQILARNLPWVSLESLVDAMWDGGVPVIHVSEFPRKSKKMDGMAVMVKGRPVLVLCKNHGSIAQSLFDLAHELGHILRKHLSDATALVDTNIQRTLDEHAGTVIDREEREANASAIELLTGHPERRFKTQKKYITGDDLAVICKQHARRLSVDPGVLAMSVGYTAKFFGSAMKACQQIDGNSDAADIIRAKMRQRLDLSRLSQDDAGFLLRVTGGEGNALPVGQ